ncbi:outer membrane lipoprotein-sorting protein [candidate division KSB1 bacterium]|nr:outer membrane lipoprotein-sorting protein [candidate division KSB1 bacterium]
MKNAIIWFLLLLIGNLPAQELTGEQIIHKVNDLMNQETMYARMTMTIITTSGQERTFEYESWSKDFGEKNLIRYSKPRRVKDQAILMLNNADDIWAYFPRTKRVRKLATHAKKQKMQGSDFSYEDMGSGDAFINDFEATLAGEEEMEDHDCYKVELTKKKNSDSHYSRLVMWVIKENFVPVTIDYFDEDDSDRLLKRLVQYDIKEIGGVPTGMKLVMYSKEENKQTSMHILECKYNLPLDDNLFTERGMKK